MKIEFDDENYAAAKIKVVGVGGSGGNAVNRMISSKLKGVEFIVVNTDKQALDLNQASVKIQIGENLTKGLGAGGDPEIGRQAIEESREKLMGLISDSDMVFITAGMGGGTGTGAAPIIAEMAKKADALAVGIVTKPFLFEGTKRQKIAMSGIENLKDSLDTLIAVPNQKLLEITEKNMPFTEAFKMADDILYQATKGISDIINVPGVVNVDFMDIRTIMKEMGDAIMGTGIATGENRGREAAEKAISSPLLENVSINGARGVLININGGKNMTLYDIDQASTLIKEEAGKDANIIFGAVIDESLSDEIRVTVIATGFNSSAPRILKEAEIEDIVDFQETFNDSVDIGRLINEAAEEFNKEKSTHVVMDGKIHRFDRNNSNIPTFLRRQAD